VTGELPATALTLHPTHCAQTCALDQSRVSQRISEGKIRPGALSRDRRFGPTGARRELDADLRRRYPPHRSQDNRPDLAQILTGPSSISIGHPYIGASLIEKRRQWLRDSLVLPPASRSTNMSAPIYPIHLRRDFERRWAAKMALHDARRSPPEGAATCVCGDTVTAPSSSTYSPDEVSNYWECSECGRRWKTIAPSHAVGL
jgi:hypothetical protein